MDMLAKVEMFWILVYCGEVGQNLWQFSFKDFPASFSKKCLAPKEESYESKAKRMEVRNTDNNCTLPHLGNKFIYNTTNKLYQNRLGRVG